ncbi:AMP-dependent synthetase and ligase [Beijerinckiaceae bacterium RH AL1]|nr:long-chain-acyl-CoA synthetase [Beijerinckiaceae bacterium]VVB48121.1 AMP-dependent synthetase and ligase [Beijerinckiaceae bacterium RH CH11]VVB48198.1 AMP-dependent synthetase and ligase [Beijerinckiaceae bacterium RH AL8]VVC56233.1 AMP-dependent synthetase and ligase [Beijerinckiaceae bacterium RH AL1]
MNALPPLRPERPSANADWVRALQRTADITPGSTRTLARALDEAAEAGRPALIGDTASLDYASLVALANQAAHWALGEGLRPGDRVALMLENQPAYPALWIGLSRVGIVAALLNTQLVGAGLAHALEVAAARHVIASPSLAPALAEVLEKTTTGKGWVWDGEAEGFAALDPVLAALPTTAPEAEREITLADPALLIYTSGTTGLPKAAHVSHFRIMMWSEWFAGVTDARADDRLYDCLPMYHSVGGVVAVGAMLVAGGAVIVRKGFSASGFWADVAASGATIFQYIGELCRYLAAAPEGAAAQPHRLRLAIGNGLRADVWRAFETRFAIPRIIEFYAATEGSFSLFNLEGEPGAIGRIPRFMAHRAPIALVAFDVAREAPVRGDDGFCRRCDADEVGEAIGLVAANAEKLATRFEGYTDEAASERKLLRDVFAKGDVWFRTGDLMRRDGRGFYYFVDRIGDTFRWKGENVATSEVADVLAAHPGVREVSVYGVAVPGADGRAGMAALVAAPDLDLDALHAHLAARLPRYACPVFLRLRERLAVTGTFKVQKATDVAEGFDPGRVHDPLYVDGGEAYVRLDETRHAAIVKGEMRL